MHPIRTLSQRFIYRAPGERDDCPSCGSTRLFDLDVLPLRGARTGFVCGCEGCGLVFSNPLPTAEQLAEFYSSGGEWAAGRETPHDRKSPDETTTARRKRGGAWTRFFEGAGGAFDVANPAPGACVLDFGCGEGDLLDVLQDHGWETWGIEPSYDRAFKRHRRLDRVPAEETFDLVIILQVLEHVADPLRILRDLAAASRPGAHLLVSVPRFDTLPGHRDYRYVINGRNHITAYTWACLATLLARSGWEPLGPPPAMVSKGGGGRMTASRLRVIARRSTAPSAAPANPAAQARQALRAYYAAEDARRWPARIGLLRLAAREEERRRRTAKRMRRLEKARQA